MCQADRQLSRRPGGGDHGGTLLTGLLSSLLCYFSLQSGPTNPGMPLPHRHTLGLMEVRPCRLSLPRSARAWVKLRNAVPAISLVTSPGQPVGLLDLICLLLGFGFTQLMWTNSNTQNLGVQKQSTSLCKRSQPASQSSGSEAG